jgi:uncharacterized protein
MSGMDRATGAEISDFEDVRQSIADILWTPIGSRIARRDYGSRLPDLFDTPANAANLTLVYAAVATAIRRWEPRVQVKRVALTAQDAFQGRFVITLQVAIIDAGVERSYLLTINPPGASA